jgi:superfamily II DNA helicase RecQ
MQIKLFTIPATGGEQLLEEMNAFMRGKKVLQVDQKLIGRKPNGACWCFSIGYVEDVAATERERGKVDYRELLDPASFNRFSAMRVIRKELAQRDKVSPYIVFNDFELSELAKLDVITPEAMRAIKGIGEKKVEKYGQYFLPHSDAADPARELPPDSDSFGAGLKSLLDL